MIAGNETTKIIAGMKQSSPCYEKTSFKSILSAIDWAKNALNLRDWDFYVEYGGSVPEWVDSAESVNVGVSISNASHLYARIWIDWIMCKEVNVHPLLVVMHEMLHVLFNSHSLDKHDEGIINTLSGFLFRDFIAGVR
jgi:hypothetical protein